MTRRSPRASPRVIVLATTALAVFTTLGSLVAQETPQPTTPAPAQQPAVKKPETATKPPAQAGTPAATAASKPAPAQAAKTTPAQPAKPAAAGETDSDAGGAESKAPSIFVPTQKTSADNSATFPIDI